MSNKTTLLDIFNNIQEPISEKVKNNTNSFKQIPFIQKYIIPHLTHKKILIGILFFVLIWLTVKWFMEYVYVNASSEFKTKQKLRREKFLNFIKSIFNFIYKSLTPFTLLIFLYIAFMFKDKVKYVFKIIADLFIFILSMINTNHILKFVALSVVLIIICFIGKNILESINVIQNKRDSVSYLVNNTNDVLKEIGEIENTINDNEFNIKEHARFIKSNLLDWSNIKQTCNQDKKIKNAKLADVAVSIPTKLNNNINIYNIRNKTSNEMQQLREYQLEEREKLLKKRRERLQQLQTDITYAEIDAHKKTLAASKILAEQQKLLDEERRAKNELENIKQQTLVSRLRQGRIDPMEYQKITGKWRIM